MPRKKKTDDDLLTFDEDSPLFVKKKKTVKKKPKYESEAETASKEGDPVKFATKRKRKTKPKKEKTNPNTPKYMIKGPSDCKHISAPSKKLIVAKWITLEDGNSREAGEVPNWIRGFASVIKDSKPKEYEELKILIFLARQIAEERNRDSQ